MKNLVRVVVISALGLPLLACSSSDDDDDSAGGGVQLTGFFLDDAVEGLEFRAGDGPVQTTDENGTFTYVEGEPLTFLVDGVELGTLDSGAPRCTPLDFDAAALNIARFLQSLDQTPGTPGIDLTDLDIPDTAIDFTQSGTDFGADPAVAQAVADAGLTGGTGVLVDEMTAQAALDAALGTTFEADDFSDKTFFYSSADGVDSGMIMFDDDGSGIDYPLEDVAEDTPGFRGEEFTWEIVNDRLFLVFGDENDTCTIARLGLTGNRYSITSECVDEGEADDPIQLTLFESLPLEATDFNDNTFQLQVPGEGTDTYAFDGNFGGTATFDEGGGQMEMENFEWSLDDNLLTIMGTSTQAPVFDRAILITGTLASGTLAFLAGETDGADPTPGDAFNEADFNQVGEITDLGLTPITQLP